VTMSEDQRFQRIAGATTMLSFLPALASVICLGAAANFSPSALSNPDMLVSIGTDRANLFRWGMVLDVFGYYVLLVPLALLLWKWLKPNNSLLVTLYTVCGFGYILVGAMGAILLSAVEPPLIIQYAHASNAQREILQTVFTSFLNAVYLGWWNPLEALFAGIWWVGIGSLLRHKRRGLGIASMLLGVGALLDAFGNFTGLEPVFLVGVSWLVLFFFVWVAWCGSELLRQPSIIDKTRQ
jgi:Domain of unknown function (DUF4386)